MAEKTLLRLAELDLEYGIKNDFFTALSECYGPVVHRGLGERLYKRSEVESALDRHAEDGHPGVKAMEAVVKAKKAATRTEKGTQ